MNKTRWVLFFAMLLAAVLPIVAQDDAARARAAAGCGPSSQMFDVQKADKHPVGQVESGKAPRLLLY